MKMDLAACRKVVITATKFSRRRKHTRFLDIMFASSSLLWLFLTSWIVFRPRPTPQFTYVTSTGLDIKSALKNPGNFKLDSPNAPSCDLMLNQSTVSFTLALQLSADRMWMLPHHCKRWGKNPISAVILSDNDATTMKERAVSAGCMEEYLTVKVVKKSKYDPKGTEYPVNILRNLALSAVNTSHVVYADMDFWPASNLYSTLSHANVKERLLLDPHLATVIPAFQMERQCEKVKDCRDENIPRMPTDRASLFELLKTRDAAFFDFRNYGGHGSTKYHTWKDQEEGTLVDLPCILSNRYEPYLAVRYCKDLPPFQEGFKGYGKNKMSWVMQLRRRGYIFSQLGGTFFIHYPHLHSKARKEFDYKSNSVHHKSLKPKIRNETLRQGRFLGMNEYHQRLGGGKTKIKDHLSNNQRARVDKLFVLFRRWMELFVKDEARTPICEDAQNDDHLLVASDYQGA